MELVILCCICLVNRDEEQLRGTDSDHFDCSFCLRIRLLVPSDAALHDRPEVSDQPLQMENAKMSWVFLGGGGIFWFSTVRLGPARARPPRLPERRWCGPRFACSAPRSCRFPTPPRLLGRTSTSFYPSSRPLSNRNNTFRRSEGLEDCPSSRP